MLVPFPPTFVADTKIIYGYNFVAPLNNSAAKFSFIVFVENKKTVQPVLYRRNMYVTFWIRFLIIFAISCWT